jgi:hypothetical protein
MPGISYKILHRIYSEYVLYNVRCPSKFSSWEYFGNILEKIEDFPGLKMALVKKNPDFNPGNL